MEEKKNVEKEEKKIELYVNDSYIWGFVLYPESSEEQRSFAKFLEVKGFEKDIVRYIKGEPIKENEGFEYSYIKEIVKTLEEYLKVSGKKKLRKNIEVILMPARVPGKLIIDLFGEKYKFLISSKAIDQ